MHEHEIALPDHPSQFPQELPAFFILPGRSLFEHFSRPENRPFRSRIESLRVEQCRLIVVPENTALRLHHTIDAFAGIGTVTDDVSQTISLFNPLRLDVSQHRSQRFEVAVNVADQGSQIRISPSQPTRTIAADYLVSVWKVTIVDGVQAVVKFMDENTTSFFGVRSKLSAGSSAGDPARQPPRNR